MSSQTGPAMAGLARPTPTDLLKLVYFLNIMFDAHTVQLNLNFTYACRHMRVLARLTHAKLKKLVCACTVACDFGVRMRDSKHTQHTRDARHKLALGLPHYMCGVTTGTVAVGNKLKLLCS